MPAAEPDALVLTSCMSPSMDGWCRELAAYLEGRLGRPVRAALDPPWQERERMLVAGQAHLGWICGLPYVRLAGELEPLAAPVMAAPRYQNRPVYFSDVVVRREDPFRRLEDLRGAAWAYNEPNSHSGYGVVRCELARRGLGMEMFGKVVEAGAHVNSIEMILGGEADASAIDSTVLELELKKRPELGEKLRSIETFGPSPMPPWTAPRSLPEGVRAALRDALVGMERDAEGRGLLQRGGLRRMAAVRDEDYELIREMGRIGGVEV